MGGSMVVVGRSGDMEEGEDVGGVGSVEGSRC